MSSECLFLNWNALQKVLLEIIDVTQESFCNSEAYLEPSRGSTM